MPADHGRKADGASISDEMVEAMADEAEWGYDVEEILRRRRGGRPPMGSGPSSVESVRLDPNSNATCSFVQPKRTSASPRPSAARSVSTPGELTHRGKRRRRPGCPRPCSERLL